MTARAGLRQPLKRTGESSPRTIGTIDQEVEICPDLLPQPGPTGDGDSKVNSETYPVAE